MVMRLNIVALMSVKTLQHNQKVELVKVVIGHAKTLGVLQALPQCGVLVALTVAIQRVAHLATQEQMDVEGEDMDMVQMAEASLETINPSTGKRARQQKCHGDLLQTTVEVILTVSVRSQRTTWILQRSASSAPRSNLRETITFSRSSMTSPHELLCQQCRPKLAQPRQVHSGDGCRSLHALVQVVVPIQPKPIARWKVVALARHSFHLQLQALKASTPFHGTLLTWSRFPRTFQQETTSSRTAMIVSRRHRSGSSVVMCASRTSRRHLWTSVTTQSAPHAVEKAPATLVEVGVRITLMMTSVWAVTKSPQVPHRATCEALLA